jgi:hypothetical protein
VDLTINNTLDNTVTIYWINRAGKAVYYKTLEGGDSCPIDLLVAQVGGRCQRHGSPAYVHHPPVRHNVDDPVAIATRRPW